MKSKKYFISTPFKHEQQVTAFFTMGQSCIKSAEALFRLQESSKKGNEYTPYEYQILLIHGIELLLNSFILLKDVSSFDDGMKKLKDYEHNYKKLYNYCLKLDKDNVFSNEQLKTLIYHLSDNFYKNIIDARFPKSSTITHFPFSTFLILNNKLIKPLNVMTINYWRNVDSKYRKKKELEHQRKRKQ